MAVGWELGDTLEASLAIAAGPNGAPKDYIALLESHGFLISMSRTGNPYDNAKAEGFMKTFKCEEVCICKVS